MIQSPANITIDKTNYKIFKVASVSRNTNSFGLYGMILVAKDGTAYETGANHINVRKKGDFISVPLSPEGLLSFFHLGFEIPHRLDKAPPEVVKEIWG